MELVKGTHGWDLIMWGFRFPCVSQLWFSFPFSFFIFPMEDGEDLIEAKVAESSNSHPVQHSLYSGDRRPAE